jgi:hypothetical protein
MSTDDSIYRKVRAHLANWRQWEWNPVLLKELRQAVRSHALNGTLILLLILLLLASSSVLAMYGFSATANQQVGRAAFEVLLIVLAAASLLFVPLYTGVRLASERMESEVDLMFSTPLPTKRIVRGKLLCGAYLAAMFFSVCAPFMAFCSLLRGVDLWTIFFILICLYSVVCLAVQAAILFACLPFHWLFKLFIGLLFAGVLMLVGIGLMIFFFDMLRSGVAAILRTPGAWLGFFVCLALITAGIQLFHGMSVALIIADSRPRGYYNEVIQEEPQWIS